jgi:hypothetical protein
MSAQDKQPEKVELPEERFKRRLNHIRAILDTVRGVEDVRNLMATITKPDNAKSSSNISAIQVNAIVDCYWFYQQDNVHYKALKDLADEQLMVCMSESGWAVEKGIQLVGADAVMKAFNGTDPAQEKKRSRLPWRKEKKQ